MDKKRNRPAPLSWFQHQNSAASTTTTSRTDSTSFGDSESSPLNTPTATAINKSPTIKSPGGGGGRLNHGGGSGGNLAFLASRRGSRDSQLSPVQGGGGGVGGGTGGAEQDRTEERKRSGRRRRRRSNFLELPVFDHRSGSKGRQHRISSLPVSNLLYNAKTSSRLLQQAHQQRTTGADEEEDEDYSASAYEDELYRLRSFNITEDNQVVNCGDSFINKRSKSNTSVNSSSSRNSFGVRSVSPFEGSCCGSGLSSGGTDYASSCNSLNSIGGGEEDETAQERFRVVLLGHSSVGKSALVSQFMTSEYINTYDVSLDDEFGERLVSVLLDGLESELNFVDHPSSEMSPENCLSTYDPHGCIVVYSVTDRQSYEVAGDILRYLWQEGVTQDKAVILVANKCDLERARGVSMQEGKSLATAHECKFIETSSGIQHNVDELLVGTLKQCRLRQNCILERRVSSRKKRSGAGGGGRRRMRHGGGGGSRTSITIHLAREIIGKLCFYGNNKKSKSCQNLHVL